MLRIFTYVFVVVMLLFFFKKSIDTSPDIIDRSNIESPVLEEPEEEISEYFYFSEEHLQHLKKANEETSPFSRYETTYIDDVPYTYRSDLPLDSLHRYRNIFPDVQLIRTVGTADYYEIKVE